MDRGVGALYRHASRVGVLGTLGATERRCRTKGVGMLAKPKSNSVVTHTLAEDGCTLTFKVRGAGEFVFDVMTASAENQHRAAIHGFVQRISDGAAIARNTDTGRPATPEEKMARMQAIAAHYASGGKEWGMPRGGNGSTGGAKERVNIVVRALAALQGVSVGEALEVVRARAEKGRVTTKAYLARLATAQAVIDKVVELRAAEAKADADGDGLLADLLDGGAGEEEESDDAEPQS